MSNLMQTVGPMLASWGGDHSSAATARLLAIWFGPAIVAALATSWISGRRGDGFGKGAGVGIAAAFVAGIFGCAVPPALVAAPLVGIVAAVVTVLRT
jgi:hypothetical protein